MAESMMALNTTRYRFSAMTRFQDCSPEFVDQWKQLENSSENGNPFLSPEFVFSITGKRADDQSPVILACEDLYRQQLIGLSVFESVQATKHLPLPHLVSLQHKHALRGGMLLRPFREQEYFEQLLKYLRFENNQWFGIEFCNLPLKADWVPSLQELASEFGGSFRLYPEYEAPVVKMNELSENGLTELWSSSRRKTMKKSRKRLSAHGDLSFRVIDQGDELPQALDLFIEMEQASWKGDYGTALATNQVDRLFADRLLQNCLRQNSLAITQLLCGDQIAATALNLRSANDLFAFKIAWNQQFEQCSPGTLHEVELVHHIQQQKKIKLIDGCTKANSYLCKVWPHRRLFGRGILSTEIIGRGTGRLVRELQKLKRWTLNRDPIQL